jgi:poly(3-hydroxyalkanoate) synthetase
LVQAGKTPITLKYEEELAKLRYYPPLSESSIIVDDESVEVETQAHRIPLVIVPPLAANLFIYDLVPERSFVKYLRAKGFEVYLIDWGVPDKNHDHYTLATYFSDKMPKLLAEVRQHSGEQTLSLHGWSLGSLFNTCYASLGDPDIENIISLAGPCDYHANGGIGKGYQSLEKPITWLKKSIGLQPHHFPKRLWRSPGWANSLGFKLMNPMSSIQGYLELLKNLHDEDYVIANATNAAFLDGMLDYPGGTARDMFQHLIIDNVLTKGKLPIKGNRNAASKITSRVLLICGDKDTICTRENSLGLLNIVASEDTDVMDVSGGHMSVVSGSKAPKEIWPQMAEWLAERSNP